jgi:DNA-binding response OmpR family regulator
MATVLILATDRMIGGLLGQLTELAGHSAQFPRQGEEAGESVRTVRPDLLLLDAAYARSTLDIVVEAAASVDVPVVYFASALPASELRRFALERGAKYFALPAGPKLLGRVLSGALAARGRAAAGRSRDDVETTARDAVAAAVAAVARARALADRSVEIRTEGRILRAEREAAAAECRRSQAELREAVIAYTRELRGAGVPPERTLEMVRGILRSEGHGQHERELARDLDDAVEWCLQAYYAA